MRDIIYKKVTDYWSFEVYKIRLRITEAVYQECLAIDLRNAKYSFR